MGLLRKLYGLLITIASAFQSVLLLVIRLYWGWQFAQAGWGKLQHLDRVTKFFTSLGIPMPHANAIFISVLELAGGILLALGLSSRLIALLFVGDMVVAYITADHEAFFSFISDPDKFVAASPFAFLLASLVILVFGPGRFSLDALLGRWFTKRTSRK